MNGIQFQIQQSAWFILLFLIIALAYALLLYKKENPWGKKWNNALAIIRFLAVFLLCLLFLDLSIERTSNRNIRPTIVLSIDNSLSVPLGDQATFESVPEQLEAFVARLQSSNYQVKLHSFEGQIDDIPSVDKFNYPLSKLDHLIKEAEQESAEEHLAAQVLFSDGIYNSGLSPLYFLYKKPIYSLGWGDTIPKKDILIKEVRYNKISYKGNKFPVNVDVQARGFEQAEVRVQLLVKGKLVEEQKIDFTQINDLRQVDFLVEATDEGVMPVEIKLTVPKEDYIRENNSRKIYVEVIEGKQKIALFAAAPHPDIKALRAAVESNGNYELSVFIASIDNYQKSKFDLAILYQLPDNANSYQQAIRELEDANVPLLYFYGDNTAPNKFRQQEQFITVKPKSGRSDLATPVYYEPFSYFQLTDYTQNLLSRLSPVYVPYADIDWSRQSEVLMFQQISGVNTDRPLLVLHKSGAVRKGVFMGENLWQWRLQEFAMNEQHRGFDEVVIKTVQFLASKEDKRRFRAYPAADNYHDQEPVFFESELYNDLYEKVYGNKINLRLTNNSDSAFVFNFENTAGANGFNLGSLPSGVYHYEASTQYQGVNYEQKGEFSVDELNIETLRLTADFDLLRTLSNKNRGKFYPYEQINKLADELIIRDFPAKIITERDRFSLRSSEWFILLILLLLFSEWFFRKYLGGY